MRTSLCTLIVIFTFPCLFAQQPIIHTVAGGGAYTFPSSSTYLNYAYGVAVNSHGEVHFTLGGRVHRIDDFGVVTVVAGLGSAAGQNVPPLRIGLIDPRGLSFDVWDNLYIADGARVERIDGVTGFITTVAGATHPCEGLGDGGPAMDACFSGARSAVADAAGNLYFSGHFGHRVRRVDHATGIITTIAGNGQPGFSGDGGPAGSARLSNPEGVALDHAGGLLIADSGNQRIRRVDLATGLIETIAGGGSNYHAEGQPATTVDLNITMGVDVDDAGHIYFSDYSQVVGTSDGMVWRIDEAGIIHRVAGNADHAYGDGIPATEANLYTPQAVAVDKGGTFYVADIGDFWGPSGAVRRVDGKTTLITSLFGNECCWSDPPPPPPGDVLATNSSFIRPAAVAFDAGDNLVIVADTRIIKVDAQTGIRSPYSPHEYPGARGAEMDSAGNLYIAMGNSIREVDAGGGYQFVGGTQSGTLLNNPADTALDPAGDLLVADTGNHRIRKLDFSTGSWTTVAGNGTAGFSGDGGPAPAASLNSPTGVAVDAFGNIYVADRDNSRIRRIDASTQVIMTVAGNASSGYGGDDGLATDATLGLPYGVAVDQNGNIFVTEQLNARIRRVDGATGIITTFAGNGTAGFGGDGGPAVEARINFQPGQPAFIALNSSGDLALNDWGAGRVRLVSLAPPAPGAVPDGAMIAGTPLRVRTSLENEVVLTWDRSCSTSDIDYAVYRGTLGDYSSHEPVACSTGGATGIRLPTTTGSSYFLVVPRNGVEEGSYGVTSAGFERGQGAAACVSQNIGRCATCGDGMLTIPETCEPTIIGDTCENMGFDGGPLGCNSSCKGYETSTCTICGDGIVESPEPCDGANLNGQTCESIGHGPGTITCNATCDGFDTSNCGLSCGDGVRSGWEICDDNELGGETCQGLGFQTGNLACSTTCAAYDTSGCSTCGNGVREGSESCDGIDLAGDTCQDHYYTGGTLGCLPSCGFDWSGCTLCGNGQLEPGELCDGSDLAGWTCEDLGFPGGALECLSCGALDTSGCYTCGNSIKEPGETCDGTDLGGETCVSLGFGGGSLSCRSGCGAFNTSGCLL